MIHLIARGPRYVAVFSAEDADHATRILLGLFASAGLPVEEMEVMEFDPSEAGGVLLANEEGEVARLGRALCPMCEERPGVGRLLFSELTRVNPGCTPEDWCEPCQTHMRDHIVNTMNKRKL